MYIVLYVTVVEEHISWFENYDLDNIITPVKANVLDKFLTEAGYDLNKKNFIVDGFTRGFPLHYEGNKDVKVLSNNLKLRVGSKVELWKQSDERGAS